MKTQTSIIDKALVRLGIATRSANAPTQATIRCMNLYFDQAFANLLKFGAWSFATKWKQLVLTGNKPIIPEYSYEYHLPEDMIKPLNTYNQMDYQLNGKTMYSSEPNLKLRYIFQCDISDVDTEFEECLVLTLAHIAVYQAKGDPNLMAQLEKERNDKLRLADNLEMASRPSKKMARTMIGRSAKWQ